MTAHVTIHWHATTCSGCHRTIDPSAANCVRFGEFWYHGECVPTCRTCGRSVVPPGERSSPGDETAWAYHAHVVSTPFGYAQRPTGFLCPICLDGALRDEAPYLD